MSIIDRKNPTAGVAREIENLILDGENSESGIYQLGTAILSRALSVSLFPTVLTCEILFKRIPKAIASISCFGHDEYEDEEITPFQRQMGKVIDYSLCLLCSPLGLYSPDAVSVFRLTAQAGGVRPFGVEEIYGKTLHPICYPKSIQEVQQLVLRARDEKKQISIIGAGMSQGTQTVPQTENDLVLHTKYLNSIEIDPEKNIAIVGSGAIWEMVQIKANQCGKSVIVKQASDIFSVGGSIGINCHGWAHEVGAIASTVISMTIVDAEGEIRKLSPEDELFGCMFGTLGFFGVVCEVALRITDNEVLIQSVQKVSPDDFVKTYYETIKGKNIPLFGGRLSLDTTDGGYFKEVQMLSYEKVNKENLDPLITPAFTTETKWGKRVEQTFLQALGQLGESLQKSLLDYFWKLECDKMSEEINITRNEALHPNINPLTIFHESKLHAYWLQEYFIKGENLPAFLNYLSGTLITNKVCLINATIRPTPKDTISILPYAEQDRFAVVICFYQKKIKKEIEKTRKWIEAINQSLVEKGDVFYQAYMPYATRDQFEKCYGEDRVENLRALKMKYDPTHVFGNEHTNLYFV